MTVFNLMVSGIGWAENTDTFPAARVFEYTREEVADRFSINGAADYQGLTTLPCLFMQETHGDEEHFARVGTITHASLNGREVMLEYFYDPNIPPISNQVLEGIANELNMDAFEFVRTHWAVKDIDLFRVLLRHIQPRRQQPRVFNISDPERIEPTLISAMMPFHPGFDNVYSVLQRTAESVGFRCRRADDIWENPAVIQDVVSLIDLSRIIICDCTGRNPNVFYEIGIAHTLGRETILITQSEADIPFDLRHLRFVSYLNNGEGLEALRQRLLTRLEQFT